MEKKKLLLTGTIILIILLLMIFISAKNKKKYDFGNTNNTQNEIPLKEDNFGKNDTFNISTESGSVDVLGYITIEKIENFDNEETFNYVFFNIVDTKSNDFKTFLEGLSGNTFGGNNKIGLGCIDNEKIYYFNSSDGKELESYEIGETSSKKILDSKEENPIKLRLTRLEYNGGTSAPICYSHITNVEVIGEK
jgi:hypothetical protein